MPFSRPTCDGGETNSIGALWYVKCAKPICLAIKLKKTCGVPSKQYKSTPGAALDCMWIFFWGSYAGFLVYFASVYLLRPEAIECQLLPLCLYVPICGETYYLKSISTKMKCTQKNRSDAKLRSSELIFLCYFYDGARIQICIAPV